MRLYVLCPCVFFQIRKLPKAEEDLEAIWNYSFRQFGIVQADAYIGRIAAVFDVLAMHEIGTHRAELGHNTGSLPVEQHIIYFVSSHSVVTIIRIQRRLWNQR
ncbi:type II toxin-antitoxin system RelE/ParE family toxin [Enterobacter cancerogenus]|uniref:type II toxin-antitoxin system RelE/ParE family toxin n=1 Tax=Enterobacter cancerogenus TaxID=69218 RepID=UPI00307646FD